MAEMFKNKEENMEGKMLENKEEKIVYEAFLGKKSEQERYKKTETNFCKLRGKVSELEICGEDCHFLLKVKRKNNDKEDLVPCVMKSSVYRHGNEIKNGDDIVVFGEIKNAGKDNQNKNMGTDFLIDVNYAENSSDKKEYENINNDCILVGELLKKEKKETQTEDILVFYLKVDVSNSETGYSYINCVAYKALAKEFSKNFNIGDTVRVAAMIHSRKVKGKKTFEASAYRGEKLFSNEKEHIDYHK